MEGWSFGRVRTYSSVLNLATGLDISQYTYTLLHRTVMWYRIECRLFSTVIQEK